MTLKVFMEEHLLYIAGIVFPVVPLVCNYIPLSTHSNWLRHTLQINWRVVSLALLAQECGIRGHPSKTSDQKLTFLTPPVQYCPFGRHPPHLRLPDRIQRKNVRNAKKYYRKTKKKYFVAKYFFFWTSGWWPTPPVRGRPLWPSTFRPDVFDGWSLI